MYFVIDRSINGQYFFRILGRNNETLAVSATFSSREAAQASIDSIRREAGKATVEDMTGANRERRLP